MSEEIKDMIEPIPNWEFTYRYDGSRTCGKSYTQSLLDEKRQQIKDLQQKVEQLENIRKETIEYINNEIFKRTILVGVGTKKYTRNILDNILNILNKGE